MCTSKKNLPGYCVSHIILVIIIIGLLYSCHIFVLPNRVLSITCHLQPALEDRCNSQFLCQRKLSAIILSVVIF